MGRVLRDSGIGGESEFNHALGQILRLRRKKMCWSIDYLGGITEITSPMLGGYENGKYRLRVSLMRRIALALSQSPVLTMAEAEVLAAKKSGEPGDIETGEGLVAVISAYLSLQTMSERKRLRCLLEKRAWSGEFSCDVLGPGEAFQSGQLN